LVKPAFSFALPARLIFSVVIKGFCSAATGTSPIWNTCNKFKQIKGLDDQHAILTWLNAISMVRAAFKGGGSRFSLFCASYRVSTTWLNDMADGTNDSEKGSRDTSPDEAALSARLGSLDKRLSEVRGSRKTGTDQQGGQSDDSAARASAMARGLRLSSELIAGVVAGAAIGWGIDYWLSTSPFGLIVFFLLGFVAGMVNVVRSAGAMSRDR
jgi:ATP synthase protein I